jgi:hypothetical protein
VRASLADDVPLIEISALPTGADVDPGQVMRKLNRAVAEAVPCRLDAVWATWRWLDAGYAVGDAVADRQPESGHAPIVHVYVNRPPDAVERICHVIEDVVTRELSIAPDNVFVTVQPVFAVARTAHET